MLNFSSSKRIAWKLISSLIVFSMLLTVGTTAIQLWTEYDRDIRAIDQRFDLVERSYTKALADAVWEADTENVGIMLRGITEFPDFVHAQILDENAKLIVSAGKHQDKDEISKSYLLFSTFRGKQVHVGTLEVAASLTGVYARAWDRVGLILMTNAFTMALVAAFVFALVYQLLTRHLEAISRFAINLDFTEKTADLDLGRGNRSSGPDELDDLVLALNKMKSKLFNAFTEERRFSEELEVRVRGRTRALLEEVKTRKRTTKDLALSESRLRDIAESGSDWMWEMGPDLCFTYMSGGAYKNAAYEQANVIGRHRSELAADVEDKEKWQEHMINLESHKPFRDFEYKLKSPSDEYVHVRVSGKPIFDDNGLFMGYRGVGSNITAEVEASVRALKAQADLHVLSSAMEQNPSAVFITSREGKIEFVNDKFTQLTGYSADEAIGQNPRILKSADTPPEVHKEIWERIINGMEWRGEIKDRCRNGNSFWAYATIAPVKNEAGEITHFVATHEDITARKSVEESLRDATERAKVANRTKSELMANMSHELRTPLNAIIGFSDTMLNEVFGEIGNERYAEYTRDIHDSGIHLLDLINDILDVSAIEAGKLDLRSEPLEAEPLLNACIKLVKHRADTSNVALERHIEKGLPNLLGDGRRMKQILLNLLSNAVKFTPENGKVTVSISTATDGGVRVMVEDTGIGMDEAGIEIALAQFGQVDSDLSRKYEGTGLGLPLTKSLVEAHQGTLDIRSRLGFGTTVVVDFPVERSLPQDSEATEVVRVDGVENDGKRLIH